MSCSPVTSRRPQERKQRLAPDRAALVPATMASLRDRQPETTTLLNPKARMASSSTPGRVTTITRSPSMASAVWRAA